MLLRGQAGGLFARHQAADGLAGDVICPNVSGVLSAVVLQLLSGLCGTAANRPIIMPKRRKGRNETRTRVLVLQSVGFLYCDKFRVAQARVGLHDVSTAPKNRFIISSAWVLTAVTVVKCTCNAASICCAVLPCFRAKCRTCLKNAAETSRAAQ